MTTKVTVAANHGWDVKVTKIYASGSTEVQVVPANTTEDFYIHDSMDVRVSEIQPTRQ